MILVTGATGTIGRPLVELLTGPRSESHEELVAIIGDVIGRPLRYQEVPPEAFEQAMIQRGLPRPFVEALTARYARGVGPAEAVSFVVTLGCGLLLVYGLLLVLSTLSFWFVRVENLLAIFWSFLDAGRFPVDVYPGWLRLTLSSVVPIGVAVTIPARAIAGHLDPLGLLETVVGTAIAFAFASWFWRHGLKSYTGASA